MRRLDPAYRASFADGSTINVRSGREAMRDEIAQTCGSVDAAAFDSFVDWPRQLYLVEMPNFIDRNYDSPLGLLSSPRAVAQLVRLGAFVRLGAAVRKRFADPRLHRPFSFQALYAGLSPESALAVYAVITYMDTIEGVWFPEGGIHAVPTTMAQVAEKAGVTFRYGDSAETILRSPTGRVAGVRTTSGERIMADPVVCTLDLPTAYEELLGDLRPPRAMRRGAYSPSAAVVWHVGVRGVPEAPVAHHNIHFGEEWGSAFEALKGGRINARPVAAGDHTLTRRPNNGADRLLHALRLGAGSQPRWQDQLVNRGRAIARPAAYIPCHTGLSQRGDHRAASDPIGLAGTEHGCRDTIRAGSHLRPDRTVPPSNVEHQLPGMFFAGSGTAPGVGVPMVLISGKLAASRVAAYLGERGR